MYLNFHSTLMYDLYYNTNIIVEENFRNLNRDSIFLIGKSLECENICVTLIVMRELALIEKFYQATQIQR